LVVVAGATAELSMRSVADITLIIQYATVRNDSGLKLATKCAVQRMQPWPMYATLKKIVRSVSATEKYSSLTTYVMLSS